MVLPLLLAATAVHAETLYVIETLVVNVNSAPDNTGERVANIKSGDAVEVIERQNDQVHVRLANGTDGWVKKSYLSADEPVIKRLNERTAEVNELKQDVARLQAELASAKPAGSRTAGNARAAAAATTEPNGRATQTAVNARGAGAAINPQAAANARTPGTVAQPPAPTQAPAQTTAPPGTGTTTSATTNSDATGESNTPTDPNAHEPPYFMTPPDAPAHPVWHWALGSFVVALGLGFLLGWRTLDGRIRRKYGGLRIY